MMKETLWMKYMKQRIISYLYVLTLLWSEMKKIVRSFI